MNTDRKVNKKVSFVKNGILTAKNTQFDEMY